MGDYSRVGLCIFAAYNPLFDGGLPWNQDDLCSQVSKVSPRTYYACNLVCSSLYRFPGIFQFDITFEQNRTYI